MPQSPRHSLCLGLSQSQTRPLRGICMCLCSSRELHLQFLGTTDCILPISCQGHYLPGDAGLGLLQQEAKSCMFRGTRRVGGYGEGIPSGTHLLVLPRPTFVTQ